MQLVLTSYLRHDSDKIESRVAAAVPSALSAAAARIDVPAHQPRAETNAQGVAPHGVDILAGTKINWERSGDLTTIRVVVPWETTDGISGRKLIAANRFAQVLSTEAGAAA
jgi:hypothetical protein